MTGAAVMIWGELLWDRFPDGDQLGGAPANVAWNLGQAGGWAQLVTRVGDDADGRRAIARLADVVDTSLIQIDAERATGEVSVRLEHGEPRYTLHAGRAWERIEYTLAVQAALAEASVLVYGTLAQRTADGLAGWRAAAGAAACLRVCDLNLRPADRDPPASRSADAAAAADDPRSRVVEALELADVIKINDRELAALHDWLGWRDPVAELLAGRSPLGDAAPGPPRARRGGRVVAVTHGAAGSTLHGEAGAIEIPSVRAASGGDNVGCGDAYLAILVHGMTAGWDLATSGHAASRWAAAVAGARGATPTFDDDQVADLLEIA